METRSINLKHGIKFCMSRYQILNAKCAMKIQNALTVLKTDTVKPLLGKVTVSKIDTHILAIQGV